MNISDGRLDTTAAGFPVYRYARPAITVDLVVLDILHDDVNKRQAENILLITRANGPCRGMLALPGGYTDIENGETTKEAGVRELRQETGMVTIPEMLYPVGLFDKPGRAPNDRVMTMAYWCLNPMNGDLMRGLDMKAGDDAANVQWYPLRDVLKGRWNLAFDHLDIVKEAVFVIKNACGQYFLRTTE